jgi:hypothetical protein
MASQSNNTLATEQQPEIALAADDIASSVADTNDIEVETEQQQGE